MPLFKFKNILNLSNITPEVILSVSIFILALIFGLNNKLVFKISLKKIIKLKISFLLNFGKFIFKSKLKVFKETFPL